jgi:O-acetyl-ADP-ribose deacetylase
MPSSFERVASIVAIVGAAYTALGSWARGPWLTWLGYGIAVPFVIGATIAVTVGVPLALLERWRGRRQRRVQHIMKIAVVQGDVLDQDVECLVNAWNRNLFPWWLLLPQGVSAAIKRKAGVEPFRELRQYGLLPLGGAIRTGPGRLSCKGIIHVAGIGLSWRSSEYAVRAAVRNAIALAQAHGYLSIAFPLIGAGTGGLDPGASERIMLATLNGLEFDGEVRVVRYRAEAH